MGDPRRKRKRYSRPSHPWREERVAEEKEISKKYGLKNKKEIWRAKSSLARFRKQARSLLAGGDIEKDKKELLDKLNRLGIMETRSLDDVLALSVENILDRRLQTIVYKRGLARTVNHSRQLVSHGHVIVEDRIVNVPGYIVSRDEENDIRVSEKIKVIDVGDRGDKEKPEAEKAAG